MNMGLKKERFISIQSSQTSLTRASTINHADCIDTKRILKDLCTSRSFKTTWFRRWMRLSGQSIWLRWFMLCGSIHGQQLSKCISHIPQSWFSLQGNCFNILHRSCSQCVKLRLYTDACLKHVVHANSTNKSKNFTKRWRLWSIWIQIRLLSEPTTKPFFWASKDLMARYLTLKSKVICLRKISKP